MVEEGEAGDGHCRRRYPRQASPATENPEHPAEPYARSRAAVLAPTRPDHRRSHRARPERADDPTGWALPPGDRDALHRVMSAAA